MFKYFFKILLNNQDFFLICIRPHVPLSSERVKGKITHYWFAFHQNKQKNTFSKKTLGIFSFVCIFRGSVMCEPTYPLSKNSQSTAIGMYVFILRNRRLLAGLNSDKIISGQAIITNFQFREI